MSILEFGCHKLLIAHGLTRVTLSLHGWGRCQHPMPTPTWVFLPRAPQVMGVALGSPFCPWCCRHSLWRHVRQLRMVPLEHPVDVLLIPYVNILETLLINHWLAVLCPFFLVVIHIVWWVFFCCVSSINDAPILMLLPFIFFYC